MQRALHDPHDPPAVHLISVHINFILQCSRSGGVGLRGVSWRLVKVYLGEIFQRLKWRLGAWYRDGGLIEKIRKSRGVEWNRYNGGERGEWGRRWCVVGSVRLCFVDSLVVLGVLQSLDYDLGVSHLVRF